jgi:GntR family transcriptional regulator
MAEPAYVAIAGEYARQIRSGRLMPGTQLPSYAELAEKNGVSDIVIRKAVELLLRQGLVRSVRRRGIFVADQPNLVRVSPERQKQGAEATFQNEVGEPVEVERSSAQVAATAEHAEAFGLALGDPLTYTVTYARGKGRPISISDTFQPVDVPDVADAAVLEETVADRIPTAAHAEWLGTSPGDLVKTVHQRFVGADGRLLMISDVSYPQDRYDALVFRMSLPGAGG